MLTPHHETNHPGPPLRDEIVELPSGHHRKYDSLSISSSTLCTESYGSTNSLDSLPVEVEMDVPTKWIRSDLKQNPESCSGEELAYSAVVSLVVDCKQSKHVHFGDVDIRCYPPVLGDNPACSSGAPLSIGWTVVSSEHYDLEDYEAWRGPGQTAFAPISGALVDDFSHMTRRRRCCHTSDLQLSAYNRRQILKRFAGARNHEIEQVTKEIVKIQKQREMSLKFGFLSDFFDDATERFRHFALSTRHSAKPRSEKVEAKID